MQFLNSKVEEIKDIGAKLIGFFQREMTKYTHKQLMAIISSGSILAILLGWKGLAGFVLGLLLGNFLKEGI